jgi:hypothetical protein
MYPNLFSSKRILIKTWVQELEESDKGRINDEWNPTAVEYLSREEKQRREEEEKIKYQMLMQTKLDQLEKELQEEK